MNVLSHMARPASDEVPVAYFDFMTRDSVSIRFYYAAGCFIVFPCYSYVKNLSGYILIFLIVLFNLCYTVYC